ncbi:MULTISPECIES: TetR/AcrR family transcriptional regulator [Rhodococcus]|uniref:TetR/AcrR family transcriptional regulator n=1 Tax=Rhodococcus aetherivorans TaxID=191292 RepID=A0A5M3Y5Y5_9NOCA|nr:MULTISPECIES: TetR/AcrR family transcriptional regulator [Rhodococcus]ETT28211.1 transcriptional regulator, TetR family [Rhodococcus rhodochrous ATCC 21198]NCL77553.1 HTH-type transcriptional repressor KstR2 [Rhodococcus sp. YH1]MBC2591892.1 TetR/AcrR family transcriptional regulator [Rhodococcus aetherivorans]MDV6295672.1 TetR/AcrR family transcriptional regulator [Rhodococcus aetherivorans]NGP25521.1 TetR/AcrR family transcriptional regulator [Rhodococcus aetherivorans]
MTPPRDDAAKSGRRAELLDIAAQLFASRGVRATTVRDIADAAGILSGSLYHHFDSKESMVDEILRGFLDDLFGRYREIVASGADSRATLEALITASYESIDKSHAAVAIYQDEAKRLVENERFSYISDLNTEFRDLWVGVIERGIADGTFRPDVDVELVFRFLRDTVWVAVRWYRPGGTLTADKVAQQYLSIVLDGLANP